MRIGLIQTRGIGDIIIALPIAQYLISSGHEIVWPIDSRLLAGFRAAAPAIHFRPVTPPGTPATQREIASYFLTEPLEILRRESCDIVRVLYSKLNFSPAAVSNPQLAHFLKFDEYKYAVVSVPFAQKWRLVLERNEERERALFERIAPDRPYVLIHADGSDAQADVTAAFPDVAALPIVHVQTLTDSVFDWLLVIERAAHLIMIDSCFANLIDQLSLDTPKHLILRTPMPFTPVYRSGWTFVAPGAR